MRFSRRGFLGLMAGAAAVGAVGLDLEALWTPGKKTYFLPSAGPLDTGWICAETQWTTRYYGESIVTLFRQAQIKRDMERALATSLGRDTYKYLEVTNVTYPRLTAAQNPHTRYGKA